MAYKRVEVPAAELERQREICAKIREGLGGARPLAFAYPFGFHCDETEALLRARGYLLALTCENRVDAVAPGEGLLTLGRFNRSANLGREEFFALLGIK